MIYQVKDASGKVVYENGTIHTSGIIRPGETGTAVGIMILPMKPGRYQMDVRVAVNGLGYCSPLQPFGDVVVGD
jgi:hypothetical protein